MAARKRLGLIMPTLSDPLDYELFRWPAIYRFAPKRGKALRGIVISDTAQIPNNDQGV